MEIEDLLREAVEMGFITCKCGNKIEADCPVCGECGWENPLVAEGYI